MKSSKGSGAIFGMMVIAGVLFVPTAQAQTWILQPQFSDEFNYPAGTTIDTKKWYFQVEAHNNNEAQQYTDWQYNVPAGQHTTDYNLKATGTTVQLVARKQTYNNYQYTSCRLNSQCRMAFTYGKIEWRMKPPDATISGLWPAVWMLGNNVAEAPRCAAAGSAGWPSCGEVDMWEYQSSKSTSYITNGFCNSGCGNTGRGDITTGNQAGVWRIYSCEWNSTQMKYWYREDTDPATTQKGLQTKSTSGCGCFSKNMCLLINVAVGGSLGTPIVCSFPQTMELDYIRVYKLPTDPQTSISSDPAPKAGLVADWSTLRFNGELSKFEFENSKASRYSIALHDLQGRLIATLFEGELAAGVHEIPWNARLHAGIMVATVTSATQHTAYRIAGY